MSCRSPARLASLGFRPNSAAITPHSLATSRECCNKFCPYEERYFIRPTHFTNSGCSPCIPRSITVRFPISTISSSICLVVFSTTSSIRAGCIRPSVTSLCSERRAISRRTESKQERIIASGVSSTIISTPVAASRARMLRPSRPMIRPFTSSDSRLNTDTQLSTASSVPIRCMVLMIILRASWCAVSFASSIVFCI